MTASKDPDNKPLIDTENLTRTSTDKVEGRLNDIESVDFMIDDQDELVDLDALFDALNIAAKEGADAMSYIDDQDRGGVLTVTNEAFAALDLDDLGTSADNLTPDKFLSDES